MEAQSIQPGLVLLCPQADVLGLSPWQAVIHAAKFDWAQPAHRRAKHKPLVYNEWRKNQLTKDQERTEKKKKAAEAADGPGPSTAEQASASPAVAAASVVSQAMTAAADKEEDEEVEAREEDESESEDEEDGHGHHEAASSDDEGGEEVHVAGAGSVVEAARQAADTAGLVKYLRVLACEGARFMERDWVTPFQLDEGPPEGQPPGVHHVKRLCALCAETARKVGAPSGQRIMALIRLYFLTGIEHVSQGLHHGYPRTVGTFDA